MTEQYVPLDDVTDLIELYRQREVVADHTAHYEQITNEINAKIASMLENVEEF